MQDAILDYLKKNLSEKRLRHSVGAADTAEKLAKVYGCDPRKARLAGLLHDCAREADKVTLLCWIDEEGIRVDPVSQNVKELLHGPAAVHLCKSVFGILDQEILSAVLYHTTGKEAMSLLEKIIFLADFIEPARDFKGVEDIRKLAYQNLDKALLAALDSSIRFILAKNGLIHTDTILARNYLILEKSR